MLMFSTMPRIGMPTFSNILRPLRGVEQRDVLRRGDDHRAGHRHVLRQRELDVAGARRQVDHQVVEVAPVGVASNCSSAWVTIGPRQTIGVSASIRKPIDITWMPWASMRLQRLAVRRFRPAARCPASSAGDGP